MKMVKAGSFLLAAWIFVNGCAKQPTVRSNVDLDQLINGKSKALADRHEAIPNTYFELTAGTADNDKNSPNPASAVGTLGPAGQVACVSATEMTAAQKAARCEITVAGAKFQLKAGDAVTLKGSGEVALSCIGDAPARCRALVVN